MTKKEQIIGAGLGVAAVAALGTYFLYGKWRPQPRENNRLISNRKVKSWKKLA